MSFINNTTCVTCGAETFPGYLSSLPVFNSSDTKIVLDTSMRKYIKNTLIKHEPPTKQDEPNIVFTLN